ncbi:hypothetical protein FY528_14620 [Hymenobacter lutimineralis]|uniref:Uncharacterized protein n=1 Tax=Hymenobacter lutimineralis TaxID=2606448 RepID=A0A5D6UVM4_9BACT|nr:hypothetical protein [Hymenobacter lutimineralis]TYZ07593.1 hypothetical protein FY528_14620 [Hymenobacter lutimineralis]
MSIFGSDRPSGTMGGLLSGLFGGRTAVNSTTGTYDSPARPGGLNGKLLGGALLAAGAAYLYNRNKNKAANVTGFFGNK